MTEQNTASCAAKKVCYGATEVEKMKRPKYYMEIDILRDRSDGKGEHLKTIQPKSAGE